QYLGMPKHDRFWTCSLCGQVVVNEPQGPTPSRSSPVPKPIDARTGTRQTDLPGRARKAPLHDHNASRSNAAESALKPRDTQRTAQPINSKTAGTSRTKGPLFHAYHDILSHHRRCCQNACARKFCSSFESSL